MEIFLIVIATLCFVFVAVCAISLGIDWGSDWWNGVHARRRNEQR